MTDSRFYINAGPFTLNDLASATHSALKAASDTDTPETLGQRQCHDVAPLDKATSRDVSFLDNVKYVPAFEKSNAGACFVHPKHTEKAPHGMILLVSEEPYAAYAKAAALFYPPMPYAEHIADTATIHHDAVIGEHCCIEPGAVIEAKAHIGNHTRIGANAVIAAGVQIGEYCDIGANSTISHAILGNHVRIHRGVHIGQDGFGFAPGKEGIVKVPQLGRVLIEDYVDIGSGTCIDRGAGPDTVIGAHTKIDNLVQIGHNVRIGKYVFLAGQVGIAGSTVVEDYAQLGGQVGLAGHLHIGKGAKLAAQSGVMNDIPAGETHIGAPAIPNREFFRQVAALKKLTEKKGN